MLLSRIVRQICHEIDVSIDQQRFLNDFRMSELPLLNNKLEKLLNLLKSDHEDIENYKAQIINVLQDIMEIITQDVMTNGHTIVEKFHQHKQDNQNDKQEEKFQKLNLVLTQNRSWMDKVIRLHLLLTVKESAINVPMNLEDRRRITFFANSLFMNMPSAPKVRNMLSFSFSGIAKNIAASGYAVYAVDHPGFGLFEGLHGYIRSFDELVDNVIERYTKIKGRPEASELPRFLLGQSMGGAVVIKAHLKRPTEWDGVVLVAPMCKVNPSILYFVIAEEVKPAPAILKILTVVSNFLPKAKLVPENNFAELAFRETNKKEMAVYNVISYSDQMRLKTAMELLNVAKEIESQWKRFGHDRQER